jgi:hypothetical protein
MGPLLVTAVLVTGIDFTHTTETRSVGEIAGD